MVKIDSLLVAGLIACVAAPQEEWVQINLNPRGVAARLA